MRIMAIGTLNNAFVDAVFHRHIELRANRRMATVAEFGLFPRQQEFRYRRVVNGVAVRADNIGFGMRGSTDIGAGEIFRVATEARVDYLRGRHLRKRADRRLSSASRHVIAARTVAALAAGLFGSFFPRCDRLVVRVPVEVLIQIDVAEPALFAADVLVGLGRRRLRDSRGWQRQRACDEPGEFHLQSPA